MPGNTQARKYIPHADPGRGVTNLLHSQPQTAWIVLAVLQLAALIIWAIPASALARTRTSIAAAAVSLISTLGLCILSYVEHVHTVRPSSFLNSYLFVTILCDIAHARTLWLRAEDGTSSLSIASLAVACIVTKAVLLVFEALEKRRLLQPEYWSSCPPEATGSIYNRYFFWWLNPLFYNGFNNVLEVGGLFHLDKHLGARYCHQKFQIAWGAGQFNVQHRQDLGNSYSHKDTVTKKSSSLRLLLCSLKVLKWPILQTIPPRAALTALVFCQPFLINRAITLSQEAITTKTTQIGYGLIGAYFLVYVGIAVRPPTPDKQLQKTASRVLTHAKQICMGQYQHRTFRTITMARAGLVSLIYRKTSTLSIRDVDPAASLTLMGADIERIVHGWQTMHEIWSNAIEVGIAIYLLEKQLGIACVVPVAVSLREYSSPPSTKQIATHILRRAVADIVANRVVSLIGSMLAMNFIMSRQAMWLEAIERRISATSAMLASMKGVKMCGLSETLLASLQKLRVDEMTISKRFRKLMIWNMSFGELN